MIGGVADFPQISRPRLSASPTKTLTRCICAVVVHDHGHTSIHRLPCLSYSVLSLRWPIFPNRQEEARHQRLPDPAQH